MEKAQASQYQINADELFMAYMTDDEMEAYIEEQMKIEMNGKNI